MNSYWQNFLEEKVYEVQDVNLTAGTIGVIGNDSLIESKMKNFGITNERSGRLAVFRKNGVLRNCA